MIYQSGILDKFIFTQQSLNTFDNCPLKFKKRYIDKLRWDGMPGENTKRRVELGNNFHLLARRYFLGIDTGVDLAAGEDNELVSWMESLKENFRLDEKTRYMPEYKLRIINSEFRLEANFDLLAINSNAVQIWDWKTHQDEGIRKEIPASKWIGSLQSMVYLFVLKEQLPYLLEDPAECKEIRMSYWQPYPPKVLAVIEYNDGLHKEFRETLKRKIQNALQYDYSCFDKTHYNGHCRYCEFNRLCNGNRVDFNMEFEFRP